MNGRPFFLFLSRLHQKKGCDLLVEAFAALAAQYVDYDLVVAGPDQVGIRNSLAARATDLGIAHRIHWPGMLQGDAKWGAFRAAYAFILPSHQENFGIVVAEALGCGTPVLITNKVNIWREVEQSGSGLVESDDLAGVKRLMSRFLALSNVQRQQMRDAARACFENRYDVRAVSRRLCDLYGAAARR